MRESLIKLIYVSFNGITNYNIENLDKVDELFNINEYDYYFVLKNNKFQRLDERKMLDFLKTEEAQGILSNVSNILNMYDVYCVIVEIYSLRLANIKFERIVDYISQKYNTLATITDYE